MQENSNDYKFCIKLALDNAKKRINLLDNFDKKCVLEEYKEWINDGLSKHTVLLLSCLLYTSPSPRDRQKSRMPSSA